MMVAVEMGSTLVLPEKRGSEQPSPMRLSCGSFRLGPAKELSRCPLWLFPARGRVAQTLDRSTVWAMGFLALPVMNQERLGSSPGELCLFRLSQVDVWLILDNSRVELLRSKPVLGHEMRSTPRGITEGSMVALVPVRLETTRGESVGEEAALASYSGGWGVGGE